MSKKRKRKIKFIYRRILLLILLLLIVFFSYDYFKNTDIRSLKKIGYTKDEISFVINQNKVNKKVLKRYPHITNLNDLVNNKNYDKNKLSKYLDIWSNDKDINTIIMIVNNNIKYPYSEKLVNVVNDKYFILNNLDRYMAYDIDDLSKIVTNVNCNLDKEYYKDQVKTDVSDDTLMIVNKFYNLDEDYHYGELVTVDKKYSVNTNDKLSKVTYDAFKELVDAAEKENLHIRSKSAYRSYQTQKNLYNRYKNANGLEWAEKWSAHPGNSEHQTGLALDVCSVDTYTIQKFESTKEFIWMRDNSYKYGFILRYPKGKEHITGYNYESWHYRYVGKEVAKYIHDNDITFEEYWAYFVNK